ncbi:hypothetical protein B0H14DRAFT_363037 [Mycena olivaceomarginata]|nr:hypothetical protein B0H14DRAFT_363037 [Mycena olivaceomarginata]
MSGRRCPPGWRCKRVRERSRRRREGSMKSGSEDTGTFIPIGVKLCSWAFVLFSRVCLGAGDLRGVGDTRTAGGYRFALPAFAHDLTFAWVGRRRTLIRDTAHTCASHAIGLSLIPPSLAYAQHSAKRTRIDFPPCSIVGFRFRFSRRGVGVSKGTGAASLPFLSPSHSARAPPRLRSSACLCYPIVSSILLAPPISTHDGETRGVPRPFPCPARLRRGRGILRLHARRAS